MLSYEKDVDEFVKDYGLSKPVAQEICSSHSQHEVSTILDFLSNYGKLLNKESN